MIHAYNSLGVLADLLNGPGPGNEPLRAQYAEQRWNEGIMSATGSDADAGVHRWRPCDNRIHIRLRCVPTGLAEAGVPAVWECLGPISSPLRLSLMACIHHMDISRNAPQLTDTDDVPIGREYLEIFLDYAAHLAVFKQADRNYSQHSSSTMLSSKAAIAYNNRMNAQNLHYETLVDRAG